jgi:hypothetical protein
MASTSESGNAINIANYKRIVDLCTEFGAFYQPTTTEITIASMTAQWTAVDALHTAYLDALDETKIPINDREILFDKLRILSVRSRNLYESTKASSLSKNDAKGFVRKITGSSVKFPKLANNVPDPKHVSNSHQSFVNQADNFNQLLNLYKKDVNYTTNEADLSVTSLENFHAEVRAANENVWKVLSHAIKLRTERDHGLYDIETGVIDVTLACKKYVRGVYGAKSPEAKAVSRIYLKRFMTIKPV